MSVRIRLQRHGKKGKPFYWIVAADQRSKRDGKYLEKLGTYNPNFNPPLVELNIDATVKWIQFGAQPSDTAKSIISKEGALLKNHLLNGVKKGALTDEEADKKFEDWVNEKNKKYFNLGKKLYFKKIGQMGLSCNQCHDERVGQNLRAEKVSQGHVNGFPTYLLRWSKIASVHKRIQFCNEQARAIPFKIFSKEYNALQLYMTWRGRGLKIETPAVRK